MIDPNIYPPLSLPAAELRLSRDESGLKVYDVLRAKAVALTPEEWVRQHFVHFLIQQMGYPQGLMANELALVQNGRRRRCDTVVHDRHGRPLVIVEYKRPTVAVTQQVFDQIARYNSVLSARWLVVSNGLRHYCCRFNDDGQGYTFVPQLPEYDEL